MNDTLKLIELCEKESDEHYSINFTIDKYGVQINGYYYPEPGLIPTFKFSKSIAKVFLMHTYPGFDIHFCFKCEINEFKKEVENGDNKNMR